VSVRFTFTFLDSFFFLLDLATHSVAVKIPERFCCATYREPCDLIVVKVCLCMFQLAPVPVSTHKRKLCGSCGADKTCVFLRLVAEMSDQFLE
jgi:hypothetical protein